MNFLAMLFDRRFPPALIIPGASISICAWANLIPVHPLASALAFAAMLVGGATWLLQLFMR